MFRFSQRLAWLAGVVLPVGETLRRWGTWWDFPPAYLDDVLTGLSLLVGAWMSRHRSVVGVRVLAAAWGFGCGIGLMSLLSTLADLDRPDPTGASGATAAVVKAVMVVLGVIALAGSLTGPKNRFSTEHST